MDETHQVLPTFRLRVIGPLGRDTVTQVGPQSKLETKYLVPIEGDHTIHDLTEVIEARLNCRIHHLKTYDGFLLSPANKVLECFPTSTTAKGELGFTVLVIEQVEEGEKLCHNSEDMQIAITTPLLKPEKKSATSEKHKRAESLVRSPGMGARSNRAAHEESGIDFPPDGSEHTAIVLRRSGRQRVGTNKSRALTSGTWKRSADGDTVMVSAKEPNKKEDIETNVIVVDEGGSSDFLTVSKSARTGFVRLSSACVSEASTSATES